jgi:predicted phosphodiesterase
MARPRPASRFVARVRRAPGPALVTAARLGAAALSALACACSRTPDAGNPGSEEPRGGADAASVDGGADAPGAARTPWRFVMVGDTHVTESGAPIASEMMPFIVSENPRLVLVAGDVVQAGKQCSTAQMVAQLAAFKEVTRPLHDANVPVYPVRGNHEADAIGSADAWAESFRGADALPANGPAGEVGLSYSVEIENALFVALDEYVTLHHVNQPWLDTQLAGSTRPHVFVFGHEPAFKDFHTDCLGSAPLERNAFWSSLSRAGVKVYLTAHDHFRDLARIDDGDGQPDNDVYQYIVGTGGGPFPPAPGGYTGDNGPYAPVNASHAVENGYLVVEVSGTGATDRDVTMTFKRRTCDPAGACTYEASADALRYTSARGAAGSP